MASGIYRLYWDNCEYFYFGQAQNFNRRKNDHLASLARGKHRNKKLQAIFNKYGIPKIEIIEYCEIIDLDKKEESIIEIHFNEKHCCNLKPAAKTMRGYHHTQNSKDKISIAQKNKIISEETRRKHSEANKNRIANGYVQTFSDQTRQKMSERHKLGKHHKARLVINKKTGVVYECAKIVSILFNINYSTLRDYLQGRKPNKTLFEYVKFTNTDSEICSSKTGRTLRRSGVSFKIQRAKPIIKLPAKTRMGAGEQIRKQLKLFTY